MKRKLLLFAIALLVLIGLKYAFGQGDETISWTPYTLQDADPIQDVLAVMIAAPLLGTVFAAFRILARRSARPVLEPIRLH